MMNTRWIDSPLGGLRLHASAGLITRIEFDATPYGSRAADPLLDRAERQLREYFARQRREFDLPLSNDGTQFQQKVWNALHSIAYGSTATYGQIAAQLGYTAAVARAVGAANGANPLPIVVPCHRVVGAKGVLTGYSGGVERKRVLLELEQAALF